MPQFEMLSGHHVVVDANNRKMVKGQNGKKRIIITDENNLDFIFGEKRFRRLDGLLSTGKNDKFSPPKKPEEGEEGEVEVHNIVAGDPNAKIPKATTVTEDVEQVSLVQKETDNEDKVVGPRDSEEVTDDFAKLAEQALVKVFQDSKGKYIVTDQDDVSVPLKGAESLGTEKAVKTFIKKYGGL